jgi:hypothetical protein
MAVWEGILACPLPPYLPIFIFFVYLRVTSWLKIKMRIAGERTFPSFSNR